MKTILTTDWAPHIEAIARRLAQVCAVVYVAGYCTGRWIHRLNDALTTLLVRRQAPAPAKTPWATPVIQRLATAAPPANIAPPRPADPMARAVLKVRSGMSQRQAASLCGVSRTSLQRALKVAA
jgi:hypothetical protein